MRYVLCFRIFFALGSVWACYAAVRRWTSLRTQLRKYPRRSFRFVGLDVPLSASWPQHNNAMVLLKCWVSYTLAPPYFNTPPLPSGQRPHLKLFFLATDGSDVCLNKVAPRSGAST